MDYKYTTSSFVVIANQQLIYGRDYYYNQC